MKAETGYAGWALGLLAAVLAALAILIGGAALEWLFLIRWVWG